MSYRTKRRRKGNGPSFVMLPWYLLDSHAWHSLSPYARSAYVELCRIYNGTNNGKLGLSVRLLAERLPCSKNTASRALEELETSGFITVAKVGTFTRAGSRDASEYRLTCYRDDKTLEPPTKLFNPAKQWLHVPERIPKKASEFGPKNWDSRSHKLGQTPLQNGHSVPEFGTETPLPPECTVPNLGTHVESTPYGVGAENGAHRF
jgi:hypothetical protein